MEFKRSGEGRNVGEVSEGRDDLLYRWLTRRKTLWSKGVVKVGMECVWIYPSLIPNAAFSKTILATTLNNDNHFNFP